MDADQQAEREQLKQRLGVRLLEVAREAYLLAGMQGLCGQGQMDLACDAVRAYEVSDLLAGAGLTTLEVEVLRQVCLAKVVAGALEDSVG